MSDKKYLTTITYGSYNQIKTSEEFVNVRFIDSNRTIAEDDSIYPKHTHFNYEIIFIENGIYKCELNKKELTLGPFEMLLIQPGQRHEDVLSKGVIWYSFHFRLHFANTQEMFFFAPGVLPEEQILHTEAKDQEFFISMIKIFENETGNSLYQNYSIHNALFNAVFKKIITLFPDNLKNEQFTDRYSFQNEENRIISVFNKLIDSQPSLQTLCKMCCMSRSSLHRNCMTYFNMPPRKAFVHFKMTHIAEFIRKNQRISIKELSETFGFKNQFHFSRVFKHELGFYPSFLQSKENR